MSNWTNYPKSQSSNQYLHWGDENIDFAERYYLAHGNGRSYGDSCLNDQGVLLKTSRLKRFLAFDATRGVLKVQSGVTLQEILQVIVPQGWMLPVVPGTQMVTIGGAIANDIHGKNHFHAGTFGCHVLQFELLRSDGERMLCSPDNNAPFFAATIGGLGLTGMIVWAEIQLMSIDSPFLAVEKIPFYHLDEFFQLNAESEPNFQYTVAWLDCLAKKQNFGRGIYLRANHTAQTTKSPSGKTVSMPFHLPNFMLNSFNMNVFNNLYFHSNKVGGHSISHFQPFFFPLDKIQHWNRIYGKRGFLQFQCVIPPQFSQTGLQKILQQIVHSRQGSFLSVLKVFGSRTSPGLLSFPMPGVTLALDFPNNPKSHQLLKTLEVILLEFEGRVYPAKDAVMSRHAFQNYFPNWQDFSKFIDEKFSSSFWRRVT